MLYTRMLILSGPSGAGKSTLRNEIVSKVRDVYFSISTTTRSIRDGEVHGKDYYFTDEKSFKKDIDNNKFLEWAVVHGNYYGTSMEPIEEAISNRKFVVFDVDVQGHSSIKRFYKGSKSVFITTKNYQTLRERLSGRGLDDDLVIQRRLDTTISEIVKSRDFDYMLVNEDIEMSRKAILDIIEEIEGKSFGGVAYKNSEEMFNSILSAWQRR